MFAVILLWSVPVHLMHLWLKTQGSPLISSLSVFQLFYPGAELTTVGWSSHGAPECCQSCSRDDPERGSLVWGVRTQQGGGRPSRAAEVLHGVLESK